jgi:D-specific alpha-keto acid dehydrogenase
MTVRAAPDGPHGLTVYGCEPDEAELFAALGAPAGIVPCTTSRPLSTSVAAQVVGNRCASVAHTAEVSRAELETLRQTGVDHLISRSIGLDHIDLGAAAELGIVVDNVVYPPDSVADFTVMSILRLVRGELGAGRRGGDLCEMTVGVVGTGRIGRAVMSRLRAFGCRVLASNGRVTTSAGRVGLDHLLRQSDVVTLHLPLDIDTHHVLGRAQLDAMRPGAYLVNTGRGGLVDTEALVDALRSRRLGGAALDVVEGEARRRPHATADAVGGTDWAHRVLLGLPNVIVTPHVAYRTTRTLRETVERTLATHLDFERRRIDAQDASRHLVRGLLGGA